MFLKLKNYFDRKSKWGIVSDVLFFLLIIGLLIPPSRTWIIVQLKKLTLFPPRVHQSSVETLDKKDLNWPVMNLEGQRTNLKKYRGKVLFVNIWATWCPPCIAEMPDIQQLYNAFCDSSDVQFFLISNENPEDVDLFLKKNHYHLPVYLSLKPPPAALSTSGIPRTFIISKEGKIVVDKTGSAKWNSRKIRELLIELSHE